MSETAGQALELRHYGKAMLIRCVEERLLNLFSAGKLFGTVHTVEWPRLPVKVLTALLALLAAIGLPRAPERPAPHVWDLLVVLVERTLVETPGIRGPRIIRTELTEADRRRVRSEILAFIRRVERGTGGRLEVRPRIVTVPGPLTTLTGPGPFWIGPRDLAPLIAGRVEIGRADTVMAFAKIGEDEGPALPVRHLAGALADNGSPVVSFSRVHFAEPVCPSSTRVAQKNKPKRVRRAITNQCIRVPIPPPKT